MYNNGMQSKDLMLRLLKYKRILQQFKALGLERVFSNNLGDALGISAALVRKDFSRMNFEGNRRGGYKIEDLMSELNRILGSKTIKDVVLVGCGNLGRALMNHDSFIKEGIRITAGFDINLPDSEINGIPVLPMETMKHFINEKKIKVGIICVPPGSANQVKDLMIQSGIKGILNFAPLELKGTDTCMMNNVNIGLELENLFFQINN